MNADQFARCIGEVDETLVEQALAYTPPHRCWKPFVAAAACLLAALALHLAGPSQPAAPAPAALSRDTPQQVQPKTEPQPQPDTAENTPQPQAKTETEGAGTSGGQASSPVAHSPTASGANRQKTGQVRPREGTAAAAQPPTTNPPAAVPNTASEPASQSDDQPLITTTVPGEDRGFLSYEKDGGEIGVTFSWEAQTYTMTETLPAPPEDLGGPLGALKLGTDGAFTTENPNLEGGMVYQSPQETETLVVELHQQYALFRQAQE